MNTHEQTTPAALHRLFARLLDDHQRMHPHHAHLCLLCQETERTLDLLADELPDGDDECPGCCAPKGEPHADSCPDKDGKCPGCAVQPGQRHLEYCPVGRSTTVFSGADDAGRFCSSTGFHCAICFAKAGALHAADCPAANVVPMTPITPG